MPQTLSLKFLEPDNNNNMNLRAFIQKLHGAMEDQPWYFEEGIEEATRKSVTAKIPPDHKARPVSWLERTKSGQ